MKLRRSLELWVKEAIWGEDEQGWEEEQDEISAQGFHLGGEFFNFLLFYKITFFHGSIVTILGAVVCEALIEK